MDKVLTKSIKNVNKDTLWFHSWTSEDLLVGY
jgi:hypothetical protein